jgi:DNA-binding transcriptional ArsR family regulator
MTKVTLDRETFKALASDTRLDILKSLDGRHMSLKDICTATKMNKATLHEHLVKLNEKRARRSQMDILQAYMERRMPAASREYSNCCFIHHYIYYIVDRNNSTCPIYKRNSNEFRV